jgi:hypothetical protein
MLKEEAGVKNLSWTNSILDLEKISFKNLQE